MLDEIGSVDRISEFVAKAKDKDDPPIFWCGSSIISFHCAIQPTVRAKAKITVNRWDGMPSA